MRKRSVVVRHRLSRPHPLRHSSACRLCIVRTAHIAPTQRARVRGVHTRADAQSAIIHASAAPYGSEKGSRLLKALQVFQRYSGIRHPAVGAVARHCGCGLTRSENGLLDPVRRRVRFGLKQKRGQTSEMRRRHRRAVH